MFVLCVTMWHVQVTMFPWKNNTFYILWVCVHSCSSYPSCKVHLFFTMLCGLALQFFFFTLSQKQHNFQKNVLNIKCLFLFSLQLTSEISSILRRIRLAIFIIICRSSCKVPVILFRFLIFLIVKKKTSNFIKICPLGVELFHVDRGHTDKTKLIVTFHNFANMPKN
jgi:hypothetical protein